MAKGGMAMDGMTAILILLALFALRFVIPLAFTLGIGRLMNRIHNRWQGVEKVGQVGV
jgi:hypothetical protein